MASEIAPVTGGTDIARTVGSLPMQGVIAKAAPAMTFARSFSGRPVQIGAEAELELRGGDRLGLDGIGCDLDMWWNPELMAAVQSACDRQRVAGRDWFTMPPILLSGPNGAGRTNVSRRLARSAGVPHLRFDARCGMYTGSTAGPDIQIPLPIPAAMRASACANPVITVEGIEDASDAMVGLITRLVDPGACDRFTDEAAGAVFDFSAVSWIIHCRRPDDVPPSLGRLLHRIDLREAPQHDRPLLLIDLLAEVLDDRGIPMPPDFDLQALLDRAARWGRQTMAELYERLDQAIAHHTDTN